MVNWKPICRLCLKKSSNFEVIQEITREVLDVLLLKINLAVSEKPVVCTNCANSVQKCFDFKSTCLYTQDYIVPFISDTATSKLDLKEIYRSGRENESAINSLEDHSVCGFCMDLLESSSVTSLDHGGKKKKDMLEKCLPELDLSVVKEPVICTTCERCLQEYFSFTTDCFNIEEKIENYCKAKGIINKSRIKLKNVVQFDDNGDVIDRNMNQSKIDSDDKAISAQPNAKTGFSRRQVETVYKPRKSSNQESSSGEMMYCATCSYHTKRRTHLVEHLLIHKDRSQVKMYKCEHCTYESRYSYGLESHTRRIHTQQKKRKIYRCFICLYETKLRNNFENHMTNHINSKEVPIYKCELCLYYARERESLKVHMLSHVFKCDVCPYQCTDKNSFKKHVHKTISLKPTFYNCEKCTFKTKFKCNLKMHMLRHKAPSEVTMYSCSVCLYETKYATALRKHIVIHKKDSEAAIYECSSCSFTTRHPKALKTHALSHKDPSELTMYKCNVCLYESKEKSLLKKHMHYVHKNPFELKMYKCASCSYQTKYKSALPRHMTTHKNNSEKD